MFPDRLRSVGFGTRADRYVESRLRLGSAAVSAPTGRPGTLRARYARFHNRIGDRAAPIAVSSRKEKHADNRATCPRGQEAQEEEGKGGRPGGRPPQTRCLHPRLHGDPEEAELCPAQGVSRTSFLRNRD